MVFSSLIFLFLYLPLVLFIYYITPLKLRNVMLLIANVIFYAWGEPIYILIMVFSTFVDFAHGYFIERYRYNDKLAKTLVASSVIINLSILFFFKYYDFLVINLTNVIPNFPLTPLQIALPIGISFYTFQTMSYTIDIYRGDAKAQKNIINFGSYVTLFPQLIAGPIVKYKDVASQLISRTTTDFAGGIELFVIGLCKKVLLANNIGMLWDTINASASISVLSAWLGTIAFAFQIYFDFSGYSDMARGLGRMLGFEFLKNFDYPYISKSITEFWRRWHISLGTWFREYVYIPLGGNRCSTFKNFRNIFIVWLLTGLWHGAEWSFIAWGLFFAILLMIEKAFLLKLLDKLPVFISRIYTLFFVLISWAIFANVDFMPYLRIMFGGAPFIDNNFLYYLSNNFFILIILIISSTPLPSKIKIAKPIRLILIFIGLILCTAYLTSASYNPFLYFRF